MTREKPIMAKPNGRPDEHSRFCSCTECNHVPDRRSTAQLREAERRRNGLS